MASSGKATGTASSAQLLAADQYREYVVIMLQNQIACALGLFGNAAVLDEGIVLGQVGDTVHLSGAAARQQINVIGNTASLTYQSSADPISVDRQGYLA
jgi:hypothetical protein